MKTDPKDLKIGVDETSTHKKFHVAVKIQRPENVDDVLKLSGGSLDYAIDCFMRGHRINLQEDSGARETVREATEGKTDAEITQTKFVATLTAEVEKLVNAHDPTAPKSKGGRPQKPVKVNQKDLARALGLKDETKRNEALRALGLKIELVTE